jgi:uncharacterized membrane-anchored protein
MTTTSHCPARQILNKVPEVTLLFWVIKMMSTTVGETAADFLNTRFQIGLTGSSLIMGTLLAIAVFFQVRTARHAPPLYWLTVVLMSVVGTLITDNMTDHFGVALAVSTGAFTLALMLVFALWYHRERTLSIHHVDSVQRELYYWLAILTTFALGTAAGDWFAEALQMGYGPAALLFGGTIALVAAAHRLFKANAVLSFWLAYILTRPFGASLGDLLSQPQSNGGLGLGSPATSALFLVAIVGLVASLTFSARRNGTPDNP